MHDIEPHFRWRDHYKAEQDERSPFYGREYDEFQYSQKIYNYYIHPQWDAFGSSTLYMKILSADYDEGFAIIELIGEWNDCLQNDIMFLKRDVADLMIEQGIYKYLLICENVLNFHGSDDCYYEEWYEDISDEQGWICLANTLDHVAQEMQDTQLQHFVNFGSDFNDLNWRQLKPKGLLKQIELLINGAQKQLTY